MITLDIRTSRRGKIRIPMENIDERDCKTILSALMPSFFNSFEVALMKISFDAWMPPLYVIHDCFKVNLMDMDAAQESIRKVFHSVCKGDALVDLAHSFKVNKQQHQRTLA